MTEATSQQRLIDRAQESRRRSPEGGLEALTFFMEPFTSAGLALLAQQQPDLKRLFLMRTELTDEGFEAVNGFRHLEELDLGDTRLTGGALLRLDPSLPLRRLRLPDGGIGPEAFARLARFRSLKALDCRRVLHPGESLGSPIDDALWELGAMPWLESLDVGGHRVLGPGLGALREMRGLRFLGLSQTTASATALAGLAGLTSLETLLLRRTGLDDDALATLSRLRNLRHLDVSSTLITDRAVSTILNFGELRALGFEHVAVGREAAERLFELPYLENLEIWIGGVEGEYWYRFVEGRTGFHLEA